MVNVNGLPIAGFSSKKPFHSIQLPDETFISPLDSIQPTRTSIDKLSLVFDCDDVTEQNKFQISNLVFGALKEFKLQGYNLFRPPAYDARGDGGYNRTMRLESVHPKRYVADLSFSPMAKLAAFYRLECNPAHLSQVDREALHDLLHFLSYSNGAVYETTLDSLRVSRLDFAADYADLRLSQIALHRPKVRHFQSHISDKGIERGYHLDGQYMGSPQSDRQVRAYEFDGLTRIELIRRFNEGSELLSAVDTAFIDSIRVHKMSDLPEILPNFHPRYTTAVTSAIERFGLVGFLKTLDLSKAELKTVQRKLAKSPNLWDATAMNAACKQDFTTAIDRLQLHPTIH